MPEQLLPQEIKHRTEMAAKELEEFQPGVGDIDMSVRNYAMMVAELARGSGFRRNRRTRFLVDHIDPDEAIVDAAVALQMAHMLNPSMYSNNPYYRTLEAALESIPTSQLAEHRKRALAHLGVEADDLIRKADGTTDLSALNIDFEVEVTKVIDGLKEEAGMLWKQLDAGINPGAGIDASSTMEHMNRLMKNLSNRKTRLSPIESEIFTELNPKAKPTYETINRLRDKVGGKMNDHTYSDLDQGRLKYLYGLLADDQRRAAKAQGFEGLYNSAQDVTHRQLNLQREAVALLGEGLYKDIAPQARRAIKDLAEGKVGSWKKFMDKLPDSIDPEMKRQVMISGLNELFSPGNRKDAAFDLGAFTKIMNKMERYPASKNLMREMIGESNYQRMEDIYTVAEGIRRGGEDIIHTGRLQALPILMDQMKTMADRLYGAGRYASRKSIIADFILRRMEPTPRSVSADALLSDPKFKKLLIDAGQGKLDSRHARAAARERINQLDTFKRWKNQLNRQELRQLLLDGEIYYLTGRALKEDEED